MAIILASLSPEYELGADLGIRDPNKISYSNFK